MMRMTAIISTVGTDGRVAIPKALREALGVEPNDYVTLALEDGTIRLRRVDPPPDPRYFWDPAQEVWLPWRELRRVATEEHPGR
jgi:AbrB family looped-hinge helix DNA binding protein